MVGGYSYYANYCPEYRAVLNKGLELGYLLPSIGQQKAQDTLMRNLVTSGIFAVQDLIYIFQNDCGFDFAKINWKNPSAFLLNVTTTYSPVWHKNLGVSGRTNIVHGDSFFTSTGWIPSSHGVNFTQNLGGAYLGSLSGYGGMGYMFFTESGTTNVNRIHGYLYDGQAGYGVNSAATNGNILPAYAIGLLGFERTASNAMKFTRNGVSILTSAAVSAARSTNELGLFGINLPGVITPTVASPNFPTQCFFIGTALSLANQSVLYNYLAQYQNTFFTANTFVTAGAANFTVPAGVTEVTVECWGGGGAGRGFTSATQTRTGGGGGGGAYVKSVLSVTPGAIIPFIVGAGGVGGTGAGGAGGDTSWNSGQILAKAGSGAQNIDNYNAPGGLASASVGDVKFNGGVGGWQGPTLASSTGSGGTSAGAFEAGIAGVNGTAGVSVSTRPAEPLLGPGACGVSQTNAYNGPGYPGVFGSGGSGARRTTVAPVGGAGGAGYIRVTWYKEY